MLVLVNNLAVMFFVTMVTSLEHMRRFNFCHKLLGSRLKLNQMLNSAIDEL